MAYHPNNIDRALKIADLVHKNYEPGRQDRCRLWVYRAIIKKEYPMSERTFWRMLEIARKVKQNQSRNEKQMDYRQGRLFD